MGVPATHPPLFFYSRGNNSLDHCTNTPEGEITDSSTPVEKNAVSSIYVEDMMISSTPVTSHQI